MINLDILRNAYSGSNFDKAKTLIENEIIKNTNEHYLWESLCLASHYGDIEMVELLLEKGSNIEFNKICCSALSAAISSTNIETVKFLLEKVANIEFKNSGTTALITAMLEGHTEIVKFLLEKGANIEAKDKYGNTALIRAICGGHIEIVKLLLEKGANIKIKDDYGNTPLKLALGKRRIEIVKLLLDRGADIDNLGQRDNEYILKNYYIPKAKEHSELLKEELVAKYYSPENIEKWSLYYNKPFDEVIEVM
jgi:ankyrin repeat protein